MSERVPDSGSTSEQRLEVAELYAVGSTIAELSAVYSVTGRTIRRWLQEPECQRVVREIRDTAVSAASGKLKAELARTHDRLVGLMDSDDLRVRLQAVKLHYDVALRLQAIEDVEALRVEIRELRAFVGMEATPV